MEIIHPSGQSYDLPSDASLEITRTNPFFNDIGEQSLPIALPATAGNMHMLNHINRIDRSQKPQKEMQVVIRSGIYQQTCRQVVFGSNEDEIDTSFYLNMGDFYAALKSIDLSTVMADHIITYSSVTAAINAMYGWYLGNDDCFTVFPVVVTDPNQEDGYKILNRIDFEEPGNGYKPFYNRIARTEMKGTGTDQVSIAVPPGYYMTPFVRINWILKEIFSYLGYSLNSSFFTETEEFRNLVILNNTADTILSAKIVMMDLLPDISASEFIDIIRQRFRCEFIANNDRTVDIRLFNEVTNRPGLDLTPTLSSRPKLTYSDNYCLKIEQSSTRQSGDGEQDTKKKLTSILKEIKDISNNEAFPSSEQIVVPAVFDSTTGTIYRIGVKGYKAITVNYVHYRDIVMDMDESMLEEQVLTLSDSIPDNIIIDNRTYPFIGDMRCVRSVISTGGTSDEEMLDNELSTMLCFACGDADRYRIGFEESVPTWRYGSVFGRPDTPIDVYNPTDYTFSLQIYGPTGIYNTFHRQYDYYMRNAFDTIEIDHYLTEEQKMGLSPVDPVVISGQKMLLDTLGYSIGQTTISPGKWKSLMAKEPIEEIRTPEDYFPHSDYYWVLKNNTDELAMSYIGWIYYEPEPVTIEYYDPPTKAQYASGGRYHEREFACKGMASLSDGYVSDCTLSVWMEPRMKGTNLSVLE